MKNIKNRENRSAPKCHVSNVVIGKDFNLVIHDSFYCIYMVHKLIKAVRLFRNVYQKIVSHYEKMNVLQLCLQLGFSCNFEL
jgi:hypothetical protein